MKRAAALFYFFLSPIVLWILAHRHTAHTLFEHSALEAHAPAREGLIESKCPFGALLHTHAHAREQ